MITVRRKDEVLLQRHLVQNLQAYFRTGWGEVRQCVKEFHAVLNEEHILWIRKIV